MTDIFEIFKYGSVEDLKIAKLERNGMTFYQGFINACQYGNIKIVEYLIPMCPDKYTLELALYDACFEGHIDIVETLIKNGATQLNDGFYACERGMTKHNIQNRMLIFETLLFHGSTVRPNLEHFKYKLAQGLKYTKLHESLVDFVLSH